jgi:CRISPR system Cascade subunit CasD
MTENRDNKEVNMPRFLILKLDGPMQAWGGHTFEEFRPSHLFPTRSGLLGLIAACRGLDRSDRPGLDQLASSLEFAVRADRQTIRRELKSMAYKQVFKMPDFHTVLEARKVDGSPNKFPVVSRREYLFDASFTVAVCELPGAAVGLDDIAGAVRNPCYTPSLGRRSCPLARPLFEGWCEAENSVQALRLTAPASGVIYAEGQTAANARPMPIRDVPQHGRHRQFGIRWVYVHTDDDGGK